MIHHRRPDGYYVWLACQFVELPMPAPYHQEHHAQDAIRGRNNAAGLTDLLRGMRAQAPTEREYGLPQYWTLICYRNGRHEGFSIIDIPPEVVDALDAREWDGYPRTHHETTQEASPLSVPVLPGQEGGAAGAPGPDQP